MSFTKANELPVPADRNIEENAPRTLHGLKVPSALSLPTQHSRRVLEK